MKQKYRKPYSIEVKSNEVAFGYCEFGSLAVGAIANLGCESGGTASGYGCTRGTTPGTSCTTGKTASNPSGCLVGSSPSISF